MVIDPTVMAEQGGGGKGREKENKKGMKEGMRRRMCGDRRVQKERRERRK